MIDPVGQLYATEADPDGLLAPDTAEAEPSLRKLRGYLVRHALVRGPLVVGDAQINNNPHLRELLWPDPEKRFPVERDLSVLLEEGHLVPVLRAGRTSLLEIYHSQRERDVRNLPSQGYVEYLDAHRHGFGRGYDVDLLARQFRRQMLRQFTPGISESVLPPRKQELVRDWILEQPTLYFDRLRAWATQCVKDGALDHADWQVIDDTAAVCYRYNIPLALGLASDFPQARDLRWGMIGLPLGAGAQGPGPLRTDAEEFSLPPIGLSVEDCARLPARLVTRVKAEPQHLRLRTTLAGYEAGQPIDPSRLAGEWADFIDLVKAALPDAVDSTVRDEIGERQRAAGSRMTLRVERGVSLGRFTLFPAFADGGSADAEGYGSIAHGTTATAMESSAALGISHGYASAHPARMENGPGQGPEDD